MSAARTIVLLPGLDGTGRLFARLLRHLGDDPTPRVVAHPPGAAAYETLLPLARAALPTDGAEFVLLGESFSGPLAVRLAAERPSGLRALVLVGTFVSPPCARWRTPLRWCVRGPTVAATPSALRTRLQLGRFAADGTLVREVADAVRAVPPRVLAARIRETLAVDARAALRDVAVPVLDLRGAEDELVRGAPAREIRRLRPDAHAVDLAAPHLVLQTRPAEAAAAIRAFAGRTVTA